MENDSSAEKDSSPDFAVGKDNLPAEMPVFPLKGFLVLPKLNLPLNIFEPRYIAMIDDALATPHRLIGMIQPAASSNEKDDSPALSNVGCASRIASYTEAPGGRYVIAVRGVVRFRVGKEISLRNGYRRVEPEWDEFFGDLDDDGPSVEPRQMQDLLSLSADYFGQMKLNIPETELAEHSPQDMINLISVISPFSNDEKQALLEAPDAPKRALLVRAFMQDALRNATPGEATIH